MIRIGAVEVNSRPNHLSVLGQGTIGHGSYVGAPTLTWETCEKSSKINELNSNIFEVMKFVRLQIASATQDISEFFNDDIVVSTFMKSASIINRKVYDQITILEQLKFSDYENLISHVDDARADLVALRQEYSVALREDQRIKLINSITGALILLSSWPLDLPAPCVDVDNCVVTFEIYKSNGTISGVIDFIGESEAIYSVLDGMHFIEEAKSLSLQDRRAKTVLFETLFDQV